MVYRKWHCLTTSYLHCHHCTISVTICRPVWCGQSGNVRSENVFDCCLLGSLLQRCGGNSADCLHRSAGILSANQSQNHINGAAHCDKRRREHRIRVHQTYAAHNQWVVVVPLMCTIPAQTMAIVIRINPTFASLATTRVIVALYPVATLFDPYITVKYIKAYRVTLAKVAVRSGFTSTLFSQIFGRNPDSVLDHTAPVIMFVNH